MDENGQIEFLKMLAAKKTISQAEKAELKIIAKSLNVPIKQTSCKDCWRDAAMLCYNYLVAKLAPLMDKKYVLRGNVDVIFNGERINENTLTDEKAVQFIEAGFPIKFFVKINDPDGEVQNQ